MIRNKEFSSETRPSVIVLGYEGYSIHKIPKKQQCVLEVQTGFNQIRKRSGRSLCTAEQEGEFLRESSLLNKHLTTQLQLAHIHY